MTVVHCYSGNLEDISEIDWDEPLTSDYAGEFQTDWVDEPESEPESELNDDSKDQELFFTEGSWFLNKNHRYIHHSTSQKLVSAALKGCQLYIMFLTQLSTEDRHALAQQLRGIQPPKNPVDYPTICRIQRLAGFGRGTRFTSVSWSLHGYYTAPYHDRTNRKIRYSVDFGGRGIKPSFSKETY